MDHVRSRRCRVGDLSRHPEDPAAYGQVLASVAQFSAMALTGFKATALGGVATAVSMHIDLGRAVRAEVLQRETLGLIRPPSGLGPLTLNRELGFNSGSFTVRDTRGDYRASGRFDLSGTLLQRRFDASSNEWFRRDNHQMWDGSRITGRFTRHSDFTRSGDRSVLRRRSSAAYQQSFDGAALSRTLEAFNPSADLRRNRDGGARSLGPGGGGPGGGPGGGGGGGPRFMAPKPVGGVSLGGAALFEERVSTLPGSAVENDADGRLPDATASGTGDVLAVTVDRRPDSATITWKDPDTGDVVEEAGYDSRGRLVRERFADGGTVDWRYADDGGFTVRAADPSDISGTSYAVTVSADGRTRTLTTPTGTQYVLGAHDGAAVLQIDGSMVYSAVINEGSLYQADIEGTHLEIAYGDAGVPSSMLLAEPTENGSYNRWLQIHFGDDGQVLGVDDDTGLDVRLTRNEDETQVWSTPQGQIEVRFDEGTRLLSVSSSTGESLAVRYAAETPVVESIEHRVDQATSSRSYVSGRLSEETAFDGRTTRYHYVEDDQQQGLLHRIDTNTGPTRQFGYESGKLGNVQVADHYTVRYGYDATGQVTSIRMVQP